MSQPLAGGDPAPGEGRARLLLDSVKGWAWLPVGFVGFCTEGGIGRLPDTSLTSPQAAGTGGIQPRKKSQ